MRLLVLDDDAETRDALTASLRNYGYAIDESATATEAEGLARTYPYDVLLVDVSLPEGATAGLKLITALRDDGLKTPVMFISGRAELRDRLAGFDAGGDDYIIKPFEVAEVHARLQAMLRRPRHRHDNTTERGDVRINWDERAVSYRDAPVHLTAKEYAILELLVRHPGRIFTREEIIQHVWNIDFSADTNVVDVYVWNLRRKLGTGIIDTIRGLGYRFPNRDTYRVAKPRTP